MWDKIKFSDNTTNTIRGELGLTRIPFYKVSSVTIVQWKHGAHHIRDISIRVGNESPPADQSGDDEILDANPLCAIFVGPGIDGAEEVMVCEGEAVFCI